MLYSFTGGADRAAPHAGLIQDATGESVVNPELGGGTSGVAFFTKLRRGAYSNDGATPRITEREDPMNLLRSMMFLATLAVVGFAGFAQAPVDSTLTPDARSSGCLSGVVIDPDGSPVAGAKVEAWASDQSSAAGIIPNTTTPEDGTFRLCRLEPGSYTVVATKDEEYYADPRLTFYSDGALLPETELRAGDEVPDIVVRVGPKVARLKGKIMDAATGKPMITDAKAPHHRGPVMVGFYEANGDQAYMDLELGCSAEFSVLVPTKPFRVSVSAPEYKTWYYGSDGTEEHAMPMMLPSATTKELTITLKPDRNEPI